ncbi:MAG: 1-(5-phosphoribosyl)-5-[(5-phosphoribosylamino)methylideneamino] imidazole-4-carboxamide isomerase [Chloroflexota bacterium]|nr:1-(5-phosphoribosyl)-5-[(5-phosphoribosylamino)methylideneamino] imidazole-4-carboxamide isomerase [Chloroflexota bacterium]
MIIYPSLDVRAGKIVRLREGDPDRQIVFSDSPIEMARRWIAAGATWLHMVNLDGAFAESNDTISLLREIASLSAMSGVRVQFGGGLRKPSDIERALTSGAARVVLGTVALTDPALVTDSIARYGAERIAVALDARNGKIATHGWTTISDVTPAELGAAMAARGVIHALYTDVNRDGGLSGANIDGTIALAESTGLQIIASGGVSSADELRALHASGVVAGAVIGMALYEGKLTLADAISAAS